MTAPSVCLAMAGVDEAGAMQLLACVRGAAHEEVFGEPLVVHGGVLPDFERERHFSRFAARSGGEIFGTQAGADETFAKKPVRFSFTMCPLLGGTARRAAFGRRGRRSRQGQQTLGKSWLPQ